MTRIIINNQEVELPVNLNLQFNTENTLFTKSSVYTGELQLSMRSEINKKIFRSIHRLDTKKVLLSYPAQIYVGDELLVDGTAKVIEITNDSISLQILGGNAEVNNKTREDNLYIDEMDLGRAFPELEVEYSKIDAITIRKQVETCEELRIWANTHPSEVADKFYNSVEHSDCVVLPAQSAYTIDDADLDEMYKNDIGGVLWNIKSDIINMPGALFINAGTQTTTQDQWYRNKSQFFYPLCPQPYLVPIIEKIVALLGYELRTSTLREKWTRRIYIPNVRKTLTYKDMMPHWSVNKFLTEVENLLGVVFLFDEKTNNCDILERDTVMSSTTTLNLVDDVYTSSDNEGDEEDISCSDIEFAQTENLLECFNEDILENAEFKEFERETDMATWYRNETDEDVKRNTICIWNNRHFISYNGTLTEANQLRRLDRDNTDSTITLGISPARTTLNQLDIRQESGKGADKFKQEALDLGLAAIPTPFVDMGSEYRKKAKRNIEGMINGYTYDDSYSELSFMPIAIAPEGTALWPATNTITLTKNSLSLNLTYCYGWTHGGEECTLANNWRSRTPALRLVPIDQMTTLYNVAFGKKSISKNIETTITFYDEGIFDPRYAFVFRGKKYVCKNIEYTIGIDGFNRKKTGVFYQID